MSLNNNEIRTEFVIDTAKSKANVDNLKEYVIKLDGELSRLNDIVKAVISTSENFNKSLGGEVTLINEVSRALYNNGESAKVALRVRTDGIKDVKAFNDALKEVFSSGLQFGSNDQFLQYFHGLELAKEKTQAVLRANFNEHKKYQKAIAELQDTGLNANNSEKITKILNPNSSFSTANDSVREAQKFLNRLDEEITKLQPRFNELSKFRLSEQPERQLRNLTAAIGSSNQSFISNSKAIKENKDEIYNRSRAVVEATEKASTSGNRLLSIEKQRDLELAKLEQARAARLRQVETDFTSGNKYRGSGAMFEYIYRRADDSFRKKIEDKNKEYDELAKIEKARLQESLKFQQDSQAQLSAFKAQSRQAEVLAEKQLQAQLLEASTGASSVKSIRARIALEEERLAQEHANRRIAIERNLQTALVSAQTEGQRRSAVALANSLQMGEARRFETQSLNTLSGAYRQLNEALQATSLRAIPVWERIGSLIGIYRVWNFAINSVIQGLKSIPTAGIEYQATLSSLEGSLSLAGGLKTPDPKQGLALATEAMGFLQKEAERTGISITTLERNYRNFVASASLAGQSIKDTNETFANLNTTITTLHLSSDRAELAFLAFSQIFNKSKVQSEELVKQLGNLLPGAFAAFAQSMVKSGKIAADVNPTQELARMMKAGTVKAENTLKDFAAYYANNFVSGFDKASTGLNSAIGRLDTAWTNFARSVFSATGSGQISIVNFATSTIKALTPLESTVNTIKEAFMGLGTVVGSIAIGTGLAKLIETIIAGGAAIAGLRALLASPVLLGGAAAAGAAGVGVLGATALGTAALGTGLYAGTKLNQVLFPEKDRNAKLLEDQSKQLKEEILAKEKEIQELESRKSGRGSVMSEGTVKNLSDARIELKALKHDLENVNKEIQVVNAAMIASGKVADEAFNTSAEAIRKKFYPATVAYEEDVAELKAHLAQQIVLGQQNPNLYKVDAQGFFPEGSTQGETRSSYETKLQILNNKLLDDTLKQENKVNVELEKQQQKLNDISNSAKNELELLQTKNDLQAFGAGLTTKNLETLKQERDLLKAKVEENLKFLASQEKIESKSTSTSKSSIRDQIIATAKEKGFDPALLTAIAQTESHFNPNAISPKGAKGVFQFMDATAKQYNVRDPFNVEQATLGAIKYLTNLQNTFHDTKLAIAAYNAGEGAVQKYDNTVPPYKETQNYLIKVLAAKAAYKEVGEIGEQSTTKITKATVEQAEAIAKTNKLYNQQIDLYEKAIGTASKIPEKSEVAKLKEFLSPSKKDYKLESTSGSISEQYLKSSKELLEIEKELYTVAQALDSSKQEQDRLKKMQALSSESGATSEQLERQNILVIEQERTLENLKTQYSAIKDIVNSTENGLKTRFDDEAKSAEEYLNKQIRRANASDKSLYLDDVRDRLIAANAVGTIYEKTSQEIEDRLAGINKQYDDLQKAMANKRLFDTLKSGFSSMLSDWINGTRSFGESFKGILQNAVEVVLQNATQKFTTALEDIISSKGSSGWGNLLGSVAQIGIAAATTLFRKTPGENQTQVSPVLSNQKNNYLGSSSFFTADTLSRNTSINITTETVRSFNSSLEAVQSLANRYSDAIYSIGDKLVEKISGTSLGSFLKPIGTFFDSISGYINKAVDWGIGLVSKGVDAAASVVGGTSSALGSKAGSAAGSAVGETASAAISAIGAIYSAVKLGFNLAEIANNKYLNTIEKVEAGLKEATLASLSIPVVGWAVAGVLHAANTTLQIIDAISRGDAYDLAKGVAFGFAGDLGVMIQEMMFGREIPSATMLSYPDKRAFSYQKDSQNKNFFTTKGPKSSGVGVDTAFGQLEMRYNDIKRISWEQAKESYQSLLENIKLYDQTLADGISKVDASYKSKNTIQEFLKVSKQFETEHDLESLSSAGMVFERLTKYIAGGLTATGTKAGITAGNWITAFADKITNSKNPDLNPVFNIEAAIGKYLPELSTMPEHLAKLFVKNVKGISEGATQAQFEQEFKDFWQGWFTASVGLQNLGTDIGLTQIEEWLASLVDLNFQVKDAGANLVAYATALKGKGQYTNDTLNQLFNELQNTAKTQGFDKAKTAQYISTSVIVGRQATDINSSFSAKAIQNLTLEMFKAATAATEQANAQIDVLITQEKLNSLTREQAIEQLRLAGKLDDTTIASANFSSSLIEQQKKFLESTTLVNNISILYSSTLESIGVSLEGAANSGSSLVTTLGSAKDAMDLFQRTLGNFASADYAAMANRNIAKAGFDSAAKTSGLAGYSLADFKRDIVNPQIAGAYFALNDPSGKSSEQAAADKERFISLTRLIQAGNDLYEAEQNATDAINKAALGNYKINDQMVSSSKEVTNAFGSLREAILSNRSAILGLLDSSGSSSKSVELANYTIDQVFQNPGIKSWLAERGIDRSNVVGQLTNYASKSSPELLNQFSGFIAEIKAANPVLGQAYDDLISSVTTINQEAYNKQKDSATDTKKSATDAAKATADFNKQLALLGKSEIKKSLIQIEEDIASAISNGATVNASAYRKGKTGELVQGFIDEFKAFGKSDIQNSLDGITKWASEMKEVTPELASNLGITTTEVQNWIAAISSQRTITALRSANSELNGFKTSISDWVAKIKETNLGTPEAQFAALQNNTLSTFLKAQSGDKTALGNITSKADSYIQAITDRYGNSDYAQSLIQQAVDAMDKLPEQLSLSQYIEKGSLDIVEEIKALPDNLAKAGITFSVPTISIPTLPELTTSTSSVVIQASSPELYNAVKLLNENMKAVQNELAAIKKNALQGINDSIDADMNIAYNSTTAIVTAIKSVAPKQTIELK